MNEYKVNFVSKTGRTCKRTIKANSRDEAIARVKHGREYNYHHLLFVDEPKPEVPQCGNPTCQNPRHITKSGNIRGYCRECENKASLKSKSKSKLQDAGFETTCCEACMNSVLAVEECTCRCGGEFHGINHHHH